MSGETAKLSRRGALTMLLSAIAPLPMYGVSLAQSSAQGNSRIVEGVLAYLGVLPAAIVRGHPQSHPEGGMHGGTPESEHQYHIVLALFEAASGKRIESAHVSVNIMALGHVAGTRRELDPMTIANTVTWGTFVKLPGSDLYDMTFEVMIPGRKAAITFPFRYSHPIN